MVETTTKALLETSRSQTRLATCNFLFGDLKIKETWLAALVGTKTDWRVTYLVGSKLRREGSCTLG